MARAKNGWLAGLEPPDTMRRLEIARKYPAHKIGIDAAKRVVRGRNPKPKDRRPCRVCGRHRHLSQSHHLIEVAQVAKVLHALAIWDWSPTIPAVSLCPTHHAYEHAMSRYDRREDIPDELMHDFARELSESEWAALIEVENRRTEAQEWVWRQVREEFLRREQDHQPSRSDEGPSMEVIIAASS